MSSEIIRQYEKAMLRNDIPDFKPGDRLRVSLKIIEGDKERLQDFEGDVIRRKGSGITETVTLRKVNYGVGVERIIPLNSPKVDKIKVVRQGRVRRAKLYYLRDLSGKAARIKEKKGLYLSKKQRAALAAEEELKKQKLAAAAAEEQQTEIKEPEVTETPEIKEPVETPAAESQAAEQNEAAAPEVTETEQDKQ